MLKKRLATLRRETGSKPSNPSPPAAENPPQPQPEAQPAEPEHSALPLAGRLRRHGRRPTGVRAAAPEDAELAAAFGADVITPGLLCVDARVALQHCHGHAPLTDLKNRLTHAPLAGDIEPHRLLFFDTETTGLSGGVGTLAFMVGLARLDGDHLLVRQLMLTSLAAEAPMLELAASWCEDSTTCVSYNGLSFDLPLLAGRCRLSGVVDRFSAAEQIDLLHPVRRAFSTPWEDCRLATVERRLLRFQRHDDLPGAEAPAAWLNFLQRGDASRLGAVLRHNYWDLLSLAALLPALDQVYRDPATHNADLGAIARHWTTRGQARRARKLLEGHIEQLNGREQRQLAWLYRQSGQWPQACALWEQLAARGDAAALEALAKYYEHQRRDFARALKFALQLPPSVQREHRCTRLSERLLRTGADVAPGNSPSAPQRSLPLR